MTDLRKAAEMALKDLTRLCHSQAYDTVEALRQALAQPVDAVNMSQERVDETAKREHEPECVAVIGNWGKVEWKEGVFPQLGDKLYTAPPKREWVGLDGEIPGLGLVTEEFYNGMLVAEDYLREKNT